MATNQVMKHCRTCEKATLHVQKSTSHVLHLLLSIITAGIWLIIWVLVAVSNSSQGQCTQCGQAMGAPKEGDYTRVYVVLAILVVIGVVNYFS
jgi:uncharacterized protein (DUF983 family)